MATQRLERLHQELTQRLSRARSNTGFALRKQQQDTEFERMARDGYEARAEALAGGAACASGAHRGARCELSQPAYALRPASSQ